MDTSEIQMRELRDNGFYNDCYIRWQTIDSW